MARMRQAVDDSLFSAGLAAHELRIEAQRLAQIGQAWRVWRAQQSAWDAGDADLPCHFMREFCLQCLQQWQAMAAAHSEFTQALQACDSPAAQKRLMLDYAAQLGASPARLRGDARAFARWFGPDALEDRYQRAQGLQERLLRLALRQCGQLAAWRLQQETAAADQALACWRRLRLEDCLHALLQAGANQTLRSLALQALATAGSALAPQLQEDILQTPSLQFVYQSAANARLDAWLQIHALELLLRMAPASFVELAAVRLRSAQSLQRARAQSGEGAPDPRDADLFVRRRIVDACAKLTRSARAYLARIAAADPSPWVRQGLAILLSEQACAGQNGLIQELFFPLLQNDVESKVRAQAACQLPALLSLQLRQTGPSLPLQRWLAQALSTERQEFVLRCLLAALEQCVQILAQAGSAHAASLPRWLEAVNPALDVLHCEAGYKVRRWAAHCAETLWLYADARQAALLPDLQSAIAACAPGHAVLLPAHFGELSAARLARMLALLTRQDFGLSLEKTASGWRLWRGERFAFRLWRWLHEMRHPSPDKRQAFRHTVGRVFKGELRIPSPILAEMSETKVPGEPLQIDSEGGWRPYLPLADELLSLLDQDAASEALRIVSSEGVTELRPPRGAWARIKARLWLSRNFATIARLRNWREDSQASPNSYLQQIRALGFSVKFHAHRYAKNWQWRIDPAVSRFFAFAAVPWSISADLPSPQDLYLRFSNYFFSAYDNSLLDLALFTAAAMAFFFGNHIWQNRLMQQARRRVPLVVGGWGTRGKSGTERIKAALFNGLGYTVVSKTTGCEAMFLYGHPLQRLREMFLFRPYDKATIWEQQHLVRLSTRLGCEVFLWECMALTPDFVQLLQRSWMRDDISTITNTFPDHEDLQGPAGINIPQVMCNFIPKGGVLLTSEEQMRPILQQAAQQLGTRMSGVGWRESGLLPPDVLARFPYQEHPDNIALVLALARELGVAPDFALKEMADRVVADLGVLKTYPYASVAGRRLMFVNGMSANERFGCLGNWTRLGFDKMEPDALPGVFLSTVVNNRGDRIARSRVFANILVEDLRADFHVLIGSNLAGLQGYIRAAWDAQAAKITLWPEQGEALQVLQQFARHLRICHSAAQLQARLQASWQGMGLPATGCNWAELAANPAALQAALEALHCPHSQALLQAMQAQRQSLQEYEDFARRLQQSADQATLDAEFRALLWQWFARKLIVVEDYYASGDSIIQRLAELIPPGCENRVMGIQNIKGTGLGFIYCWQAWDACWQACRDLLARDGQSQEQGLQDLLQMQDFGVLSEQHLRHTLEQARAQPAMQTDARRAALARIEQQLNVRMQEVRAAMGAQAAASWQETLCAWLESWLDAPDAILRRRRANRIYTDLAAERISHARAARELQDLTQRQKGGWLYQHWKRWRAG
ncbi:hypothetical protein V8J88_08175 [Massilia sp. W12]|uniref:hypothetical protein n=1 Tax=Massilia sp. W12 TaxID=3126507 RepID=UPI0030CFDE16